MREHRNALGAVAVTAGVAAAFLAWPNRRSSRARATRQPLVTYLRDHFSGSDAALRVVQRLASTRDDAEDGALFRRLVREFEAERAVVGTLLKELGSSGRSLKRAAGNASGAVLGLAAGGDPDDFSMLLTLEALAIGVQGKRCLWRALQLLPSISSSVDGIEFAALEAQAVRQWEALEARRRVSVARTFTPASSR
jgi:hypothetical protein